MPNKIQPTLFLSHGGGPWPWMIKEMPFFEKLNTSLKHITAQLPETPKAVLVISGHWEEKELSVMSSARPKMIYDYGGFPDYTYKIQYPAPGAPDLATKIKELLNASGHKAHLDSQRGFDHGVYSLLYPMYPNAEVPVFQLSMLSSYDPETHIKIGQALSSLRNEGVLIIGSGSSYHSFKKSGPEASVQFDQWLKETLLQSTPHERIERLLNWEKAPCARSAHPREDHLIPLMVAVGAAGEDQGSLVYSDLVMNMVNSSFRFG